MHSFLLSSLDTVGIISLLLFLARYVNKIYLLDPQMLACTPIKREPLISLPDAWTGCDALAMMPRYPTHTDAMKRECRIPFILTQKSVFLRSSKRPLHSSRIASLTKMQHIYCMQFTEEFLSFTPLLLAPAMRIVGIRPQPYEDKKQAPRQ